MANQENDVPARQLVVGDIIEERHQYHTTRKVVVKLTKISAVTKSDGGQDGRVAFSRKVKGKATDAVVFKVGHRDLSKEELAALKDYYAMGEYNRALFYHGLYSGLPRFEELFGYAEGEGNSGLAEPDEIVRTISSSEEPDGDKVEIVLFRRKDYGQPGTPMINEYGARVIDGEHGIVVGFVRANLANEEEAETAADLYLGKRYFGGWGTEDALQQSRYLVEAVTGR